LHFPARFEGPPGTVNGGMAVGALACTALEAASREGVSHPVVTRINARLHRPVRHSRQLHAEAFASDGAYDVSLRDGDDALITARVDVAALSQATRSEDTIADVPADLAGLLREMSLVAEPATPPFFEETGDHPIPNCFSCGPKNTAGLHVFPRFAGDGVTWAIWSPDPSMVDGDGGLARSVVASALDCSSGICLPREEQIELLRNDQFYLLGSLDVRFLRVPPPGSRYHVTARARRRDGRKFYGVSALFDDAGVAYATAEAIWIIVAMTRTQAFGAEGTV
jgi:hypothetical protein